MNIKKILMAAAAVAVLSVTGVTMASAASWNDHGGYGVTDNRDVNRDGFDNRGDRNDWRYGNNDRFDNRGSGWDRHRFADQRLVFAALRSHHIRYFGQPYFVRGHYVVRTFDRFGRIAFVEINPYTGRLVGYIRL